MIKIIMIEAWASADFEFGKSIELNWYVTIIN